MIQTIKQTDEEKMDMYMLLSKKQLAEILIECYKYLKVIRAENTDFRRSLGDPFLIEKYRETLKH